jgi:hypothetical protein
MDVECYIEGRHYLFKARRNGSHFEIEDQKELPAQAQTGATIAAAAQKMKGPQADRDFFADYLTRCVSSITDAS